MMRYAAGQGNKAVAGTCQRYGYAPKRMRNRQIYFLQGFPGIGRLKAEALLQYFGSIEKVISAEESELANVGGIGPKLARSMRLLIAHLFSSSGG